MNEKALSCAGSHDLRLTFLPAWLRNFVAACGLARSTMAYGSLGRRLLGLIRSPKVKLSLYVTIWVWVNVMIMTIDPYSIQYAKCTAQSISARSPRCENSHSAMFAMFDVRCCWRWCWCCSENCYSFFQLVHLSHLKHWRALATQRPCGDHRN